MTKTSKSTRLFAAIVIGLITLCSAKGQDFKAVSAVQAKGGDPQNFEPDSMYASIEGLNLMLIANGTLTWKGNQHGTFVLKTDARVVRAYFYKKEDALSIFFTEDEAGYSTSRAQKINLKTGEQIWKAEIPGFNLGKPIIKGGFAYVSAIGNLGKLSLKDGQYDFQVNDLYDNRKYSFNSFGEVVFKDDFAIFLSKNYASGRMDSVIVNEKTKTFRVSK